MEAILAPRRLRVLSGRYRHVSFFVGLRLGMLVE